jgi:hypothetical protein
MLLYCSFQHLNVPLYATYFCEFFLILPIFHVNTEMTPTTNLRNYKTISDHVAFEVHIAVAKKNNNKR